MPSRRAISTSCDDDDPPVRQLDKQAVSVCARESRCPVEGGRAAANFVLMVVVKDEAFPQGVCVGQWTLTRKSILKASTYPGGMKRFALNQCLETSTKMYNAK